MIQPTLGPFALRRAEVPAIGDIGCGAASAEFRQCINARQRYSGPLAHSTAASRLSTDRRNAAPDSAAKGGIAAITRSLAVAYAPQRVRVNAIAPSATMTERVKKLVRHRFPLVDIQHAGTDSLAEEEGFEPSVPRGG